MCILLQHHREHLVAQQASQKQLSIQIVPLIPTVQRPVQVVLCVPLVHTVGLKLLPVLFALVSDSNVPTASTTT
jgi:hypothetical protein